MVQRIGGLVSGMDTDTIVKNMVKAAQIPVDKLFQKRQAIQWQRQDFLDMNTKLYDYRNNKLFNFKLQGTLSAKQVNVTGDTNAITAKATGDAQPGAIDVKVTQLATASMAVGTAGIGPSTFDTSKSIKDSLGIQGSDGTDGLAVGDVNITINGTKVTFKDTDSLKDVFAKINRETNVSAYYDSTTQKVSFTAKQTGLVNGADGQSAQITFGDGDADGKGAAGFITALNLGAATQAVNAKVDVTTSGIVSSRENTSNTFNVNGVNVTLNAVSAAGQSTKLNISTDTDKIVDSIKTFVSDYNTMLKTLQDKIGEPFYRDFPALTDDQKSSMKDTEITAWEAKAKSGQLRNDSILSGIVSNMRSISSSMVNNGSKYNTLSSIGVSTGAWQEEGKLYVDEDKLKKALAEDPQAIVDLFSSSGTDSKQGLAARMYDKIDKAMKDVTAKVGTNATLNDQSILGKQMYDLANRITDGNKKVEDLQTRYYNQFAAMEAAMNKANSQSSQLAGYFK